VKPKSNGNEELSKTFFQAAAAVWGFYGTAQLALLGYIVFPKDLTKVPDSADWPLLVTLGLFFIANFTGIAILQTLAIHYLQTSLNKINLWRANALALACHLALSASSLWLVGSIYLTIRFVPPAPIADGRARDDCCIYLTPFLRSPHCHQSGLRPPHQPGDWETA
jgi:hypothetical protein